MNTQTKDTRTDRRTLLAGSVMFAFLAPLAKAARAAGLEPLSPAALANGETLVVVDQPVHVPYFGGNKDEFLVTTNISFSSSWGYSGIALIKFPDGKMALVEILPWELTITHVSTSILLRPTELVQTSDCRFAWSVNGEEDQFQTELIQLLQYPDAAFRRSIVDYPNEVLRAWVAYYVLSTLVS